MQGGLLLNNLCLVLSTELINLFGHHKLDSSGDVVSIILALFQSRFTLTKLG